MSKKPEKAPLGKIKLIDLPRTLQSTTGQSVSYAACYNAVVNGLIPAERNATGTRWLVDARQLPSVIKHFSLLKETK